MERLRGLNTWTCPTCGCPLLRETCSQFGAQRMLVLFGLPHTLHPAYLSAFNAVLPDVCRTTNRSEAGILVCAKPSCNIW
eukprot:10737815-Alexandrium_andersonii.AAC.1